MSFTDEKTRRFAANGIFLSFCLAVIGLVAGQVGAARLHGAWTLHGFLAAPGIALSGLTLFRARRHWRAAGAPGPAPRAPDLGWYVALFMAGMLMGVLVAAGSVVLLGMVAALAYLVPWTKIPVCRARFVVSSLCMLAGSVAGVVIHGVPAQALNFIIAEWMLYLPLIIMHLLVLVSLGREYRIRDAGLDGQADAERRVPSPR